MPPKRRNGEEGEEMTGREKKKLKINAARTIAVQSSSQRESNFSAGPSNAATRATNSWVFITYFYKELILKVAQA